MIMRRVKEVYLDSIILSSGVGAFLLQNWENVAYFILFGVLVAVTRVVKFAEDMRHEKRMNDLTYEEKRKNLIHLDKVHALELKRLALPEKESKNDDNNK